MPLVVSPARARVTGGTLLTLAGSAVDLSAVQDPLSGSVSALWSDTSTGSGAVALAPGGALYLFTAGPGDIAQIETTEATRAIDVEVQVARAGAGGGAGLRLALVTAGGAVLEVSDGRIEFDGRVLPVAPSSAGLAVLRLQRTTDGTTRVWVGGALVAEISWAADDASVRVSLRGDDAAAGLLTRYLRRPVVVVGGSAATEVQVRAGAHALVSSPARAPDGPAVGDVVVYAAAGAVETLVGAIIFEAPEALTSGVLSLPGGA